MLGRGPASTKPASHRGIDGRDVIWRPLDDHVDTILLATGYRPDLGHLAPLGSPNLRLHGSSSAASSTTTCVGLCYVVLK